MVSCRLNSSLRARASQFMPKLLKLFLYREEDTITCKISNLVRLWVCAHADEPHVHNLHTLICEEVCSRRRVHILKQILREYDSLFTVLIISLSNQYASLSRNYRSTRLFLFSPLRKPACTTAEGMYVPSHFYCWVILSLKAVYHDSFFFNFSTEGTLDFRTGKIDAVTSCQSSRAV